MRILLLTVLLILSSCGKSDAKKAEEKRQLKEKAKLLCKCNGGLYKLTYYIYETIPSYAYATCFDGFMHQVKMEDYIAPFKCKGE